VTEIDFFGNGLCGHCHHAANELRELKYYHNEIENFWRKKDEELQNKIDKILEQAPEPEHDDIIENYSLSLHENQIKYPNVHRNAFVMAVYSFLENKLNELCWILENCIDSSVKLKDLSDTGITRAGTFLSKVAKIPVNEISDEWSFIRHLNKLRNSLVHSGGRIPTEENNKLRRFVEQTDTLGTYFDYISIKPAFIDLLFNKLIAFFEKLDTLVNNFIQSHYND